MWILVSALRAPAFLITMWLLIVVSAIVYVSADTTQEGKVFHKCCPKTQSLVKVSNGEDLKVSYQCIDRKSAQDSYNISITPLFVGGNVTVQDGILEDCAELQMVQTTSSGQDNLLQDLGICFDRFVLEVVNGTLKPIIPEVVGLSCIKNETLNITRDELVLHHYRKCCPAGQSYDSAFHLCRNTAKNNSESWLLKRLKMNDHDIYEVDNELNCKADEYGVELKEQFFSLEVDGSTLKSLSKKGDGGGDAAPGEWCLDREFYSDELVARVCTRNTDQYGAFGVRKCCAVGYHYKPSSCDDFDCRCTPNLDDIFFNISDYLEPLLREYKDLADVIGINTDLSCPEGRTVLIKNEPLEQHQLRADGVLVSRVYVGGAYCFEAFDRRNCPNGNIMVIAAHCKEQEPETGKDFKMSFILLCISIVCLMLTLLVYLMLPELHNLHGRTLICNVSMMLLTFGCFARIQYDYVPDETICTVLGYGAYFGFIATFTWLNVICFDIWWTFGSVRAVKLVRKVNAEQRRFLWYCLYAWGLPVLLTLIMFLLDKYPVAKDLDANMGVGRCWFAAEQNSAADWPHYIFFVIPMSLVTCINFVLWVLTTRHCAKVKAEVHRLQAGTDGDRAKRRFHVDKAKYVLSGKLWVVMGAGWISELLSTFFADPWWLWSIVDFINELQGVFILIILVMKPKLYYLIRNKLAQEKPDGQKNGALSAKTSSSMFLSRTNITDERHNMPLSTQDNIKQP